MKRATIQIDENRLTAVRKYFAEKGIAYRMIPGVFYFHAGTAILTSMIWMAIIATFALILN